MWMGGLENPSQHVLNSFNILLCLQDIYDRKSATINYDVIDMFSRLNYWALHELSRASEFQSFHLNSRRYLFLDF